jgi:hypothetical protein
MNPLVRLIKFPENKTQTQIVRPKLVIPPTKGALVWVGSQTEFAVFLDATLKLVKPAMVVLLAFGKKFHQFLGFLLDAAELEELSKTHHG